MAQLENQVMVKGGKPKTPDAARNKLAALRRKTAPKKEKPEDGLARFLEIDPAIEETMRIAGLD